MTRRRKSSPSNNEKILAKALSRYQEGQLDEAGELCRKILNRMPREPSALHLMGIVHLMNGQREDAAEVLRRAAQSNANSAEVHGNLGSALRACGRLDDAEDSYRRAIELGPTHAQAHFNLGELLRQRGQWDEAIAAYRRATEIDPAYVDAFNNMGAAHEARDALDDAQACYEAAARADPANFDAGRNLAKVLRRQGRLEESLARHQDLLDRFPNDIEIRNSAGAVLAELGRYAEAAEAFERALALDPEFVDARVNLGNALCQRHRPEEALGHFERAVALDPNCADTIAKLGHALRQSGRSEAAIDAYERALAEDPDNPEANFGAAVAHLCRGEFGDGWRHYMARDTMRGRHECHRSPLAQELAGQRVLVMADQDLDDALFFLRFLPELRERLAWVAYRTDGRLAGMLERANLAHKIVGPADEAGDFDLRLSAGDLPCLLGMGDGSIVPRAIPIPIRTDQQTKMKKALLSLGPPPYVGVTWRAAPADPARLPFKEAPLEGMARSVAATEATVIALQSTPGPGEIESLSQRIGRPVHDLSAMNDDLEDMLAVLHLIDDYVCVNNANVHLRAGTGKTCRVMVPSPPEFRWMANGRESPWFPGSCIYRQQPDGDWTGAIEELRADLAESSGAR